jgi:hypothetical protein
MVILYRTLLWIKHDYYSYKLRFCLEFLAWSISIGASLAMSLTVPNPPLIMIYPFWIFGCAVYAWCAYTRKSFSMLANYILLASIDITGLIRMLLI